MSAQVLDALMARAVSDRLVSIAGVDFDAGSIQGLVRGLARRLQPGMTLATIGLHGIGLIVADLAALWAGVRLVPLPGFFSQDQIAHALAASGATALLVDPPELADRLAPAFPGPVLTLSYCLGDWSQSLADGQQHERIIFTSGTTGRPKGVRQGVRQLDFMAKALGGAVNASSKDVHFACLPLAQLLEQVAGLHLPILAGARIATDPQAMRDALAGQPAALFTALAEAQTTTTILVPRLLAAWVALLEARLVPRPDRLRLVALGGAPVAPGLVLRARALGLPVAVGYGLSECCSVVALGGVDDDPATVGTPLPGLSVDLQDGEITVSGPGVMTGYLGQAALAAPCWRTGDLGCFDGQGRLIVLGRKDTVLITPDGRNIAPEWLEEAFEAVPSIARALAVLAPDGRLLIAGLGLAATPPSLPDGRMLGLPDYALPQVTLALSLAEAQAEGLFSPDRRAARRALLSLLATQPDRFDRPAAPQRQGLNHASV